MLDALDGRLRIPKFDLALWLSLVAVCAGAIVGTTRASTRLRTTFESNRKKIEAAEKSLDKVAKAEHGANAAFIKQVDSGRAALSKELVELWQQLYDRQARFMVWPKGIEISQSAEATGDSPAEESSGKKKKAKKAKSKSAKKKAKTEEDIPESLREAYNEKVVRSEFERVFNKLNLRRPKSKVPATSLDDLPFKDQPIDFEGLVAWDPTEREAIVARHHLKKATPSSARVRLVQEDLWIFESLIDAIRSLNTNVKDALSAPVKQVVSLDVAQWAVAAQASAPEAAAEDVSDDVLLNGRYLDEAGLPLKSDAPQPFAEFNQVSIYLRLVMDQRRISDLMAALANAPLAVEIRKVAIEVLPDTSVGTTTPPGGTGPTSVPAKAAASAAANVGAVETTPWDAIVELGGVVYLYNRPDPKGLGSGDAESPEVRLFRLPAARATAPKAATSTNNNDG